VTTGHTRIQVAGELDLDTRDSLIGAAHKALAPVRELEIDLSGVTFCDSSGVSGLIAVYRMAQESGKRIVVTNARAQVERTLTIAGVLPALTGEENWPLLES
jgi:anti-anti-sigma factor